MAQAPPCPHCGASSYQLRDKRWLLCKSCGQEFDLQQHLCPGRQVCGECMREAVDAEIGGTKVAFGCRVYGGIVLLQPDNGR